MFEILDRRTSLTGNQIKILAAAIIGDALEFFDYFLIGFVLRLPDRTWKSPLGSPHRLDEFRHRRHHGCLPSGAGSPTASAAARSLSHRAELLRRDRPSVFHAGQWLDLSFAHALLRRRRVGGLYCVDLPLVQEFMPSSKRGWVGGIVTCVIPLGVGLGAVIGALLGSGDWRLLFAIGVLPACWCCWSASGCRKSPRWLCRQGRYEEARQSLAWRCRWRPSTAAAATAADAGPIIKSKLARPLQISAQPDRLLARQRRRADRRLWRYALGASLFVLLLKVTPQEAAR